MKQAWKSDNGKYYDSELDAVKADAEFWKKKAKEPKPDYDSHGGYGPTDRGDAAG